MNDIRYAQSPLLDMKTPVWRSRFIMAGLALVFLGLVGRAIHVQVLSKEFLQQKGEVHLVTTMSLPATRGRILDRNGQILASSIVTVSVAVRPRQVREEDGVKRAQLAKILDVPQAELDRKLDDVSKNFVWLKRYLDASVAAEVAALKMKGLEVQRDFFRKYPEGAAAAHVVGFAGDSNVGLEGAERLYEKELAGRPGSRRVIRDQLGHVIEVVGEEEPPVDGQDVYLSIDARIQAYAYRKLRDAVMQHKARAGSVVALDALTGEIIAMVNYPSYEPEEWPNREKWKKAGQERFRNMALAEAFEPGSSMKPVTVAMALDAGQVTPQTLINTAPGYYQLDRFTIRDVHNYGTLTVEGVIKKSSNVGSLKISQKLQPQQMWDSYTALGFGQRPEIGLKGAALGRLRPWKQWRPTEKATMSYGYGLSASLVQLARAYSAFAGDGHVTRLRLNRVDENHPLEQGARVFTAKTAGAIRKMLQMATGPGGTGQQAQTDSYSVGGKSGTARKLVGRSYGDGKYRSWFVGMAPISDPKLVIVVMIDEPSSGGYYGGLVAAPLFSLVTEQALRTLGVQPDLKIKPQIVSDAAEESM